MNSHTDSYMYGITAELSGPNAQMFLDLLRGQITHNAPPPHMLRIVQVKDIRKNLGEHTAVRVTALFNPALRVHYPTVWNSLLIALDLDPAPTTL